jgi:hypothetical protein
MKKVKVLVKNSTTLLLEEDASKGDYIDLNELLTVDQSMILESIQRATDKIYEKKLLEDRNNRDTLKSKEILELSKEYNSQLFKLKEQIQEKEHIINQLNTKLESEKENIKLTTIQAQALISQEKERELTKQINLLSNEIEVLKSTHGAIITTKLQEANIEYIDAIGKKNEEIASIKEQMKSLNENQSVYIQNEKLALDGKYRELLNKKDQELAILNEKFLEFQQAKGTEIEKTKLEITQNLQKQIHDKEIEMNNLRNQLQVIYTEHKTSLFEINSSHEKLLAEKNRQLEIVNREKALRNIKKIGENLENWCNEQYRNVSLFGFKSSTWEKDNIAIKGYGELKGTKGDYIFNVYTESDPKILLTSAMCEMKSEALESENKKGNASHYSKLDEDRKKKNLVYAILISELEYEVESDAPIFPVKEFEKMYVVRPQYFITLLGIIESIGLKYSELVTKKDVEKLGFEDSNKILADFEEFKDSILNKTLKHITTNMENIKDNTNRIISSAENIIKSVDTIVDTHLNTVKNKIENYSIRSLTKRIEKL